MVRTGCGTRPVCLVVFGADRRDYSDEFRAGGRDSLRPVVIDRSDRQADDAEADDAEDGDAEDDDAEDDRVQAMSQAMSNEIE